MARLLGGARCMERRNVDVDGHKFDTLSRALAMGTSRRRVLGAVAGSLIAVVGGRHTTQARNNACAKLCKTLFGPGKDRGQCISAGARGSGPCAAPVTGTCQEAAGSCACVTEAGSTCTPTTPCLGDPDLGLCFADPCTCD